MKDTPENRTIMTCEAVVHTLEISYPPGGMLTNPCINEAVACLELLAAIAAEPEMAVELMRVRMLGIDWSQLEERYEVTTQ